MRTKLLVLIAAGSIALGGGAAMLVGCSGSTPDYHPPASQLKDGVNLLDVKDPTWGTNAAYVQAGRVVYVETRVGPMKPEIYRQSAPGEPVNEMDMRVVDHNGYTFLIVRGGDRLIDPTWDAEIAKTNALNKLVPKAERDLDWKLAQTAAKAIAAALPATFADHAFHLQHFGAQPTPAEDPFMLARQAEIAKTPPPAIQGYAGYNSGGWSVFWTGKYSGDTGCVFWTCAKHSATDMWSCDWNGSSCSWVERIVANNHGRGPWDSGMGYDCASQGGWQYNGIDGSTAGGATGGWDGQGGCQTGYSWSSNNYAHLCNDDAAYELWEAKVGPQSNTGFWVNGSSNPPASGWGSGYKDFGDFSCSYPSGDWNTPNCP